MIIILLVIAVFLSSANVNAGFYFIPPSIGGSGDASDLTDNISCPASGGFHRNAADNGWECGGDVVFDSITLTPVDDAAAVFTPATAGESTWYIGPNHDSGGDNDDPLEFRQSATPGSSVKAWLSPAGNLGINDTSPNAMVDIVNNTASQPVLRLEHATTPTADYMQIGTAGSTTGDKFAVDSAGQVGINAPTPAYQLDISSGTDAAISRFNNNNNKPLYILNDAGGVGFSSSPSFTGAFNYLTLTDAQIFASTLVSITTTSLNTRFTNTGVGIGVAAPSSILAISGNDVRTIRLERHTTANTAGNNLTLLAGGATSGATDKNGGDLLLSSAIATGNGESKIQFQTVDGSQGAGTTDRVATTKFQIDEGHLESLGTTPTIGACGTSPSVTGTDVTGFITIGTGGTATSCEITFQRPWTNAPPCFSNHRGAILYTRAISTTTTLTIDAASPLTASGRLDYFCMGRE